MNENEIINELNFRIDNFSKNVIAIINRQNEEIEQWKQEANRYQNLWCMAFDDIRTAKSEAIKEVIKKIDELLERYSAIHNSAEIAMQDVIECDNETIEMQSVWDVYTLMANEMGSEPEEMNRLQDNIETIAKERLLKEIEKDFRLLVKEMTEVAK